MQLAEFLTALNTNRKIVITTRDNTIMIDLPSVADGIALWREREDLLKRAASELHQELSATGMRLLVRVKGRVVARLGAGAESGLLEKLLNYGPIDVNPYEVARLLLGIEKTL
ncbi:MAG: hypothetical protein HZC41_13005 [Chloroflexi bacterium]|nr:hypothetical protein [Chloroflexota bacterium]